MLYHCSFRNGKLLAMFVIVAVVVIVIVIANIVVVIIVVFVVVVVVVVVVVAVFVVAIVTLPPLESYLNWVADPMPPPTCRLADLTSPAPSGNTPPANTSPSFREACDLDDAGGKQSAVSANENSASRVADPGTQPGPSANENSFRVSSSAATRPRSAANRNSPIPGPQPGTSQSPRSALVKHPQTFQYSQHPQHPRSTANRNSEPRSRLDHPEIRGVYKPAQHSLKQDSPASRLRDSFSGFGLSSPALQQPMHKPLSGSPSGALMTDSTREARDAGGYRPGLIFPLPCAARPDMRVEIDSAPPEGAALSRAEHTPTVLDIPETQPTGKTRLPGPPQQRGLLSPRRQSRKRPRNRSSGVYQPKKRSPHRGHWCE